ncbi:MAG: HAD family hydrolase [Erysipelotrichaceae bacterium]
MIKPIDNEKYLLLVDVDGTLCGRENKVPESAAKAIQEVRNKGHLVYLVTGRALAEIYDDIKQMGYDGIIGGNGSYILSGDKMIKHVVLPDEVQDTLLCWLDEKNLDYYLECNSGLYGSKNFRERMNAMAHDEKAYDTFFPNMKIGEKARDINKISFMLDDIESLNEAKEKFSNICKVSSWGVFATDECGEFSIPGIDKLVAIHELLEYLNMKLDHCIAFGDSDVDVEMIKESYIGIAMGNGRAKAKEAADYITDDVDSDGLYKAIKECGLING